MIVDDWQAMSRAVLEAKLAEVESTISQRQEQASRALATNVGTDRGTTVSNQLPQPQQTRLSELSAIERMRNMVSAFDISPSQQMGVMTAPEADYSVKVGQVEVSIQGSLMEASLRAHRLRREAERQEKMREVHCPNSCCCGTPIGPQLPPTVHNSTLLPQAEQHQQEVKAQESLDARLAEANHRPSPSCPLRSCFSISYGVTKEPLSSKSPLE